MRRELLTSSLDLDLLELRLLEDLLRRRRRSLALRALDLETDMSGLAPALGLVTMTLGVQNRAAESSTKIRGRDVVAVVFVVHVVGQLSWVAVHVEK